ncbi:MAG: zeta toxin family protein [Lactobacillaceae bacterium]|jgi:hypothetical protein|nr:zeta toxin family protein [Lactobacillaceae bacterium]
MDLYKQQFEKACEHFFGEQTAAAGKPTFRMVFASPGAGKTSILKPLFQKEAKDGENPIMLEFDEIKAFVPKNPNKKQRMSFSDKLFADLVEKAIEEKRSINIFRPSTMRHPTQAFALYKKAKDKGYNTEAAFLAVDKRKSRLGILYRYEKALENGINSIANYPRPPKLLYHYLYFKAIPFIVQSCDRHREVDVVRVFDRSGNLIAFNNKITNEKSKTSPRKALASERKRKWSEEEQTEHCEKSAEIKKLQSKRTLSLNEIMTTKLALKNRR